MTPGKSVFAEGRGAVMTKPTAEVLRQALAAFGPEGENWAQGDEAFNRPKCCVTLAFWRIFPGPSWESAKFAQAELRKVLGIDPESSSRYQDLEDWNDDLGRTWPEVKALFEAAIAKAEVTQ